MIIVILLIIGTLHTPNFHLFLYETRFQRGDAPQYLSMKSLRGPWLGWNTSSHWLHSSRSCSRGADSKLARAWSRLTSPSKPTESTTHSLRSNTHNHESPNNVCVCVNHFSSYTIKQRFRYVTEFVKKKKNGM